MPSIRDIAVGLNEFTPELWKRMTAAICFVEQYNDAIVALLKDRQVTSSKTSFPAIITGYKWISNNQWEYAWVEAQWDPTNSVYVQKVVGENDEGTGLTSGLVEDTPNGVFTRPAYNRIETMNDGQTIESAGVNIDGADFPGISDGAATFFLQPIQGDWQPDATWDGDPGTGQRTWPVAQGPAVRMWIERDDEGNVVYAFDGWNVVDGLCP